MSIVVKKKELKTYFVYFHTFSYKFKSHLVWVACEFTYQLRISFKKIQRYYRQFDHVTFGA